MNLLLVGHTLSIACVTIYVLDGQIYVYIDSFNKVHVSNFATPWVPAAM